jgi:hypothetical protein
MDLLLRQVLCQQLDLQEVLRWALCEAPGSPPKPISDDSINEDWRTQQPQLDRQQFCTYVLEYAAEQSEPILAAAERELGTSSQPATPIAANERQRAGLFHPFANTSGQAWEEARQLQKLEGIRKRLEPGALNEDSFPSLGGVPKPNGAVGGRQQLQNVRQTLGD